MKAEILSIGSELMEGRIADTNAAWLSGRLTALGCTVTRHTGLGDRRRDILACLAEASKRADALIVTGGIGPTPDDLTRQTFAEFLDVDLVEVPDALAHIREVFAHRNYPLPLSNLIQAKVPEGATAIPNPIGTACGFALSIGGCRCFVLPGVPAEMKTMFESSVVPAVKAEESGSTRIRCLQVFGMPESTIGERLAPMMSEDYNPAVATQARDGVITVRLTAKGSDASSVAANLDRVTEEVSRRLGDAVFSTVEEPLEAVVAGRLLQRSMTVSLAESCTGGEIASRLTDVPGISAALLEALVTYSDAAKTRLLGVAEQVIQRYGAVSREVAGAMAAGVRCGSGSDVALSTTGIAGPSGGTPEKPVGLVYIGLADAQGTRTEEFHLHGDRMTIKDRAVKHGLNLMRLYLEGTV